MLDLTFSRHASRFLEKTERITAKRIIDAAKALPMDPFPRDVKRVENQWFENEKVFRIRVGDYRVLYTVNYTKNRILIFSIDKRSRVY